jgi:hypothetical protein
MVAVVEDYFTLLTAFVEYCPVLFLQSPLLSSFLQCAIACMPIEQVDAWIALYARFFKSVFDLSSSATSLSHTPVPVTATEPLVTALREHGLAYMRQFINGLLYTFPHHEDIRHVGDVPYPVGALMIAFHEALGDGAMLITATVIGEMPDPTADLAEREKFLQNLAM